MVKKYFLLIVFVIVCILLFAQQKKAGYTFHSINNLSLVNGSNAVSASLQSVNGFKKGLWFAGAGVGIDYYLYRTVPLFADLRYAFGKKKNNFFAYADAGINFNWVQDQFIDNPTVWNGNTSNTFQNGMYTDAGLGYSIQTKNKNALVLSLGHSVKSLKELEKYRDWRTQELLTKINSYNLNRIMIKVGWQF